jgi:acetyl esterase
VTLDPQARAYLEWWDEHAPAPDVLVDERRRANDDDSAALFGPCEAVACEDRTVPGPAGEIPVRVYGAGEEPAPVLVYLHGGGWVVGSIVSHDGVCATLARLSGCVVVSVEYRLAPEHPFPAALDDAWAATQWVAEHAGEIGGLGDRLAVGGDSSGGNLAAVCALRARDAGIPVALQLLVYPVCDADPDRPSWREFGHGYFLTREVMLAFWQAYIPEGEGDRFHPDASPLRAADVAGVAPAFVLTAEYDVLRDEGEAYAERLREVGVPVALHRYDGMIHGFYRLPGMIDRANDALAESAVALREAFA